jgi:hypothetical protein
MKPGIYNIEAKQSDWHLAVNWVEGDAPQNLAGFTAQLVVRYKAESATAVLELTSEADGGITLGGDPFNIVFDVDEATMKGIKPGQYVYDLELNDGAGKTYPLLTGRFTVTPSTVRLPIPPVAP